MEITTRRKPDPSVTEEEGMGREVSEVAGPKAWGLRGVAE